MTSPLYAGERGGGQKTIVSLHGFGASHAVWSDIVTPLAETARTLAYDLPGHGLSLGFPGGGPAKLAARAILADLAARGAETAHVVGHSMGGAVALLMALQAPERIASLTLLAPGGIGEAINGPLFRRYGAAIDRDEIQACLGAMSGPGGEISSRLVDECLDTRLRPGQREKLVEIAAAITRDERQGVIPRNLLATLAMPVSVMWGTEDAVLPSAQADSLPPHFRRLSVPGAGHMLIAEAPDLVLDLIRQTSGRAGQPRPA